MKHWKWNALYITLCIALVVVVSIARAVDWTVSTPTAPEEIIIGGGYDDANGGAQINRYGNASLDNMRLDGILSVGGVASFLQGFTVADGYSAAFGTDSDYLAYFDPADDKLKITHMGEADLAIEIDDDNQVTIQDLAGGVDLSANETITGNWVNTAYPWADNEVADDLTITGGSINNTDIGQTTPKAGIFTTSTAVSFIANAVASSGVFSLKYDNLEKASITYNNSLSMMEVGLGSTNWLRFNANDWNFTSQDVHLADNKRLYCGTDDDAWLRYSSTTAALEVGVGGDVALAVDADTAAVNVYSAFARPGQEAFASNDTSPSVADGYYTWIILTDSWTAGNNITSIDDGIDGQEIFIIGQDADCVIESGTGNILLPGGNWTADTATLTLSYLGSAALWVEKSRSVAPPS